MPYCLDRQEDGTWVFLNRDYKPLAHPKGIKIPGLGIKNARKKLAWNPEEEGGDRIYLYNDGCIPTRSKEFMDTYLEKLGWLAAHGTEQG